MSTKRINLLPPVRLRLLTRLYVVRLVVVVLGFVAALAVSTSVLLLPTYVVLTASRSAYEARLARAASTQSSVEDEEALARLATFSDNLIALNGLTNIASASPLLREVLSIPHAGVVISAVSYVRAIGNKPSMLMLSGTGATRDTLRTYQVSLQQAPFARSADLPVSSYAKNVDIPFSITITLAP